MNRPNVVPVLLQQRGQEVDGQGDVLSLFFLGHVQISYSHSQTQHLLQLELDGRHGVVDLFHHIFVGSHSGREFVDFCEGRAYKFGNLLDDAFGSQQNRVGLEVFLHGLAVLVEFLQAFCVNEGDACSLSLITVDLISQDDCPKLGSRHMGEFDGTGKSLVLLWVVVLDSHL